MTAHLTRFQELKLGTSSLPLYVEIERPSPDTVIVRPYGEIDLSTLSVLESVLDQVLGSRPRRLIVGLGHVDFLCARGLGALRDAHQRAVKRDATFTLAEPTPMIKRVITITGVDATVPVFADMEDALAAG